MVRSRRPITHCQLQIINELHLSVVLQVGKINLAHVQSLDLCKDVIIRPLNELLHCELATWTMRMASIKFVEEYFPSCQALTRGSIIFPFPARCHAVTAGQGSHLLQQTVKFDGANEAILVS